MSLSALNAKCLAVLGLFVIVWVSNGQESVSGRVGSSQRGRPIVAADSRLIRLFVCVTDQSGSFVSRIPESAFKLFENGVEQSIKYFSEVDTPVSWSLLIDISGSTYKRRTDAEAVSKALIAQLSDKDEVSIVHFGSEAYLDQPFTSDKKKLTEMVEKSYSSEKATAMRDSVGMSLLYVKNNAKNPTKVLVALTDGADTTSKESLERLVGTIRASDIQIYFVSLSYDRESRGAASAKRAMKAIAEFSGGAAHGPQDLEDAKRLISQLGSNVRKQYLLEYAPTNSQLDGTYRHIRVDLGNKQLSVHTRAGYYATAAPVQ